jgi:succinate dehydrogenase/fumarate reductase flavoprotein subunit
LAELSSQRRAQGLVARGSAIIGALMEACLRQGVAFLSSAAALRLHLTERRVTAITYRREDVEHTVQTPLGVVLASGGFEWDEKLWAQLVGTPLDVRMTPEGNTGDGLRLAMDAGAELAGLDQVWWMPGLSLPGEMHEGRRWSRMATRGKLLPGAITVNRAGRRFANEALYYNDFGQAMVAFDPHTFSFPNYPAFVVFGQAYRDTFPVVPYPSIPSQQGWLAQAESLGKLAERLGIDGAGLEDEVRTFDADALSGQDRFGRGQGAARPYAEQGKAVGVGLAPVGSGPYYGYRLEVGCFGTKGGPLTDQWARVVGRDHRPIRGLYAAGNVSATPFGRGYPGGGGTLGPAVVFGYLAGRHAASADS